ncbi:hypothetical protein P7C65_01s1g00860 [Encephalitozoon intestinalis]
MLIGKLEEFPSLKNPSGQEGNPLRRKKRKLILYSLYIFSVIAMCRLTKTFYWLYTLDLSKLQLNKVVYDTKTWKKIEVGISLENSESPIHVKFTDVYANLFSISPDGSENPLLSLRIPMANIAKHKNILFNGDIYIENFNRRNVIESRFSVHFGIRMDARMYPRLCFIRFPFRNSQSFSLGSSVSSPGKEVVLKQVYAESRDGMLLLECEIDNKKFNVPKFVAIRSRGVVINFGGKGNPRIVNVGPVEVDGSIFLTPLIIRISITPEWGEELKENLIKGLNGEEVSIKVKGFYFKGDDENPSEKWIGLGLSIGFNTRSFRSHDIAFKNRKKKCPILKKPLVILKNGILEDLPGFRAFIRKEIFPFIESHSILVMRSNMFFGDIYFNKFLIGRIKIFIDNGDEYFVVTCMLSEFDSEELLKAFRSSNEKEVKIVFGSSNGLMVLVNDIELVWNLSKGLLYLFYKNHEYNILSSQKDLNVIDVLHTVSSGLSSLRIDTLARFSPGRKSSFTTFQLKLVGFDFSFSNAGINAKFSVEDTNIIYQNSEEPLNRRIFGEFLMHTNISDSLKSILEKLEHNGDSSEKEEKEDGRRLLFKYNKDKPCKIRKHFFSVHLLEDETPQYSGVVIRNVIRIPCDTRFNLTAYTKNLNLKRAKPVVVNFGYTKICYLLMKGGSRIELGNGIDFSVSFSNLHDLVALGANNVAVVCDEGDYVARAIKDILAWITRRDDEDGVKKQICPKDMVFKSKLKRLKDWALSTGRVYEGITEISIPIEMFNSTNIEFDIPNVGFMVLEEENKSTPYRGFGSIEILPSIQYMFEGHIYKSFGVLYRFSEISSNNTLLNMHLIVEDKIYESEIINYDSYRRVMGDVRDEMFKKDDKKEKKGMSVEISSSTNFRIQRIGKTISSEGDTWFVKIVNNNLRDFLFLGIPNLLLKSFYGVIPSGIRFEIDMDKNAMGLYIGSRETNPWEIQGERKEDGFYDILDVRLSRILFSDMIKYNFEVVEKYSNGKKITIVKSPYHNSFEDTSEYKDWNLSSKFELEGTIPNQGGVWITKLKFSIPIAFAFASLFPGNGPYSPKMNALGMYLEFFLPFDLFIKSSELPAEIVLVSKSNDRELCRLGFGMAAKRPNVFFMSISVPPKSYILSLKNVLERYRIRRKYKNDINLPKIQQDVSISVSVNGVEVFKVLNRILIDAYEFSGFIHTLAFLEKRLVKLTGFMAKRIQVGLQEKKKKQPPALEGH